MQNNVTEFTQKLLRSLDSNYNVIDMPAVIEIISSLEKVSITKELLETTRLGKYVNQLRRNTTNESLAKRAKELVKKWRNMVLPDSNGQLKPATNNDSHTSEDLQNKKRPAKEPLEGVPIKRTRINGQMSELDFSDNSNSSFKDALTSKVATKSVIIINSDSNSSLPDAKQDPLLDQQQPKKRGRKKGSKNHKNLLEEAETSFCNKLNVSRGNAKVKTTQELLADLHIRSNNAMVANPNRPIEDLNERAAKLTERVSIIDQKLNANSNRYKNSQKKFNLKNSSDRGEVIESGVVSNVKTEAASSPMVKNSNLNRSAPHSNNATDDEIIIVDDNELDVKVKLEEKLESKLEEQPPVVIVPKSLSIEEALALLPPIDRSVLDEKDLEPQCSCQLIENKTDFSVEDEEDVNLQHTFEFVEDNDCQSKSYLTQKYHLEDQKLDDRVHRLLAEYIPSVNGNYGVGTCKPEPAITDDGLYVNVVPNVNTENLLKFSSIDYTQPASENFKKYSISEDPSEDRCVEGVAKNDAVSNCDLSSTVQNGGSDSNNQASDTQTFREWHEVLETPSYDGEILKILPYVIID